MKRSLESVLDATLVLWIILVAAQHLMVMAAVAWGQPDPLPRPDLRAGYYVLGALLLAGLVARHRSLRRLATARPSGPEGSRH